MTDHYDLAAELRILRRKYGLQLADLGELLDVDSRTLNRWESGQASPHPGAIEALRALDVRMQRRLIQRIATLKGAPADSAIPLYRDREELDAHEPFYLHLPAALYEWEVAQLVERTGRRAAYTHAWRDSHPYRAPYAPMSPALAVTDGGGFTLVGDPRVPSALAAVLTDVYPAFTYDNDPDAIAFAERVPLDALTHVVDELLQAGVAIALEQPHPSGPSIATLVATLADGDRAGATVDVILHAASTSLIIELVAFTAPTSLRQPWRDAPLERLRWLSEPAASR